MVIHSDDFISVDNGEIQALNIVLGKLDLNQVFFSYQIHAYSILAGSLDGAQHSLAWSMVSSHSIQGHTDIRTHAHFLLMRSVSCGLWLADGFLNQFYQLIQIERLVDNMHDS